LGPTANICIFPSVWYLGDSPIALLDLC